MNILNQIYDMELPKINFLERKISIKNNHTILYGPPKCGKTYLIYDYLSKFDKKDFLYIDLNDYKNNDEILISLLNDFIEENHIQVVVLENFKFNFTLPKVTSLIISTNIKKEIENFTTINVSGLDFEEYLLFDVKHQNISHSFNTFLKYGNIPEIIEYNDNKKAQRNEEICKLYCMDLVKLEILFLFIKSSGEKKSVFQLFNQMKKNTKISKDRFYAVSQEFEDSRIIHFINKYNQEKSVKKLFVFNHALLDLTGYQKKFNNLFANMIFLELVKNYKDIYYLEKIDFFIPSESIAVLSIPFFNNFQVENLKKTLTQKIDKYKIDKIYIITVSTEFQIKIKDSKVDVITFYNWVLSR